VPSSPTAHGHWLRDVATYPGPFHILQVVHPFAPHHVATRVANSDGGVCYQRRRRDALPRVGRPRLLRRERRSSTVTRDAILKSQIQPGACGWCEVNGGQWGKGGGGYRLAGQRARRARARASLGIGTDPVVLAVASRPDWSRCHTPRSGVTTIRREKNYCPTQQTTRISLPAHRMGGRMHRARSIEHTRSVRVCWPRMHGACTPQPMTLPGACMHGLRQWSANGPEPSIRRIASCSNESLRDCLLDTVLYRCLPVFFSRAQKLTASSVAYAVDAVPVVPLA